VLILFHQQMKEESRDVFQTVWKWWSLTITGFLLK